MKTVGRLKCILTALAAAVLTGTALTACGEKAANTVESIDDLKGKTIGVQIGTTGDALAGDVEDASVEKYNKYTDAVQALTQGKIDAVIIDSDTASVFTGKVNDITLLPEGFADEEYSVAVALDNGELQAELNSAISILESNGTLKQIKAFYDGDKTDNSSGTAYVPSADNKHENGTLIMATNAEFPPYEYRVGSRFAGIDVDMMNAVCDVLGYELQIDDMAFESVIPAVQSGKADVGVAGLSVTPAREKNVRFTAPYTTTHLVVMVRQPSTGLITGFIDSFHQNFIEEGRWKYLADGLLTTLFITFLAVLIGMALGFLVAIVRSTKLRTGKLRIADFFCRIYLTVIRGTPVVVQLLIIYFVIFGSVNISKILVAVLAFGINSGAYVAEIVRGGIMAVDSGQFEAGRSLGLNDSQTMRFIIMPQALKTVLPALANETIVLLKETSVAGYIAIADLTKGGDIIRSQTFSPFLPLISVAVIYLVLVMFLSYLVGKLERRLSANDRH